MALWLLSPITERTRHMSDDRQEYESYVCETYRGHNIITLIKGFHWTGSRRIFATVAEVRKDIDDEIKRQIAGAK